MFIPLWYYWSHIVKMATYCDIMQTLCTFGKYILCPNLFTLILLTFIPLGYYWSDIVKMATYCDMMQTLCTFRKYILCPNLFTLILLLFIPLGYYWSRIVEQRTHRDMGVLGWRGDGLVVLTSSHKFE